MALIAHCAPLVRDVVLAGPDRDDVAALIIPDIDACRKLAPDLAPDAPAAVVLDDSRVKNAFARFLEALVGSGPRHVGPHQPRRSARRTAVA